MFLARWPSDKAMQRVRSRVRELTPRRFGTLVTELTPQDAPQLFSATPPAFKIVIGAKAQATRMCSNYAEGAPGEVLESWAAWVFSKSQPTVVRPTKCWARAKAAKSMW